MRLSGRTNFDYEQIEPKEISLWLHVLEEALKWISHASPLLAQEMVMGIQTLVPIRSESHRLHLSASFREAPGLVALSHTEKVLVTAEALVHEYHHQKLNTLLEIDPLVAGPSSLPL